MAISAIAALIFGLSQLAAAGFGFASTAMNAKAQEDANKANKELHLQDLAFNSAEAQKERDFQLYMANTAHQREVADLKAAGLNPWLSVSGAGASSGVQSSAAQVSSSPNIKAAGIDLSAFASAFSSIKDIMLIDALGNKKR